MNFDNDITMPKLVDKKIINYYKSKLKQQELAKNITNEQIIKQDINISKWYNILIINGKTILINYYGFILLSFMIFILLYLRYKEVYRKKRYFNKIVKNI